MSWNFKILNKSIVSFEKRDTSDLKDPKKWLLEFLGIPNSSGVNVNEDSALTFSAYFAGIRILAETLMSFPSGVYYKDKNGNRIEDKKHPTSYLLSKKPNPLMNHKTWKEVSQAQAATHGNSYSLIFRDTSGYARELKFIKKSSDVTPFEFDNKLWYKVDGIELPVPSNDMFHIKGFGLDGISGLSILKYAANTIGGAMAEQDYGNNVYKTGSGKKLALLVDQPLEDNAKTNLEKSYTDKLQSSKPFVFDGMKAGGYQIEEIGMNPEEAQLLQSRKFKIIDFARFLRIPPHLLMDLERSTNNNIEHQSLEFIIYTMLPHVVRWEAEQDDKLFTEREKTELNYYTRMNINSLIRGDIKSRYDAYSIAIQMGIFSPNEIRQFEEENAREGGDKYMSPANLVPTEQQELIIERIKKELKQNGNQQKSA